LQVDCACMCISICICMCINICIIYVYMYTCMTRIHTHANNDSCLNAQLDHFMRLSLCLSLEWKCKSTGDLAALEQLARQAEYEVTRLRHKLHQGSIASGLILHTKIRNDVHVYKYTRTHPHTHPRTHPHKNTNQHRCTLPFPPTLTYIYTVCLVRCLLEHKSTSSACTII